MPVVELQVTYGPLPSQPASDTLMHCQLALQAWIAPVTVLYFLLKSWLRPQYFPEIVRQPLKAPPPPPPPPWHLPRTHFWPREHLLEDQGEVEHRLPPLRLQWPRTHF